jgi:hypothetical protein
MLVKTVDEIDIDDFQFWGGATDRAKEVKKHPEAWDCFCDDLKELEMFEGELTPTQINDIMWFGIEDELENAGLYNKETGLYYDDKGFEPVEY